MVFSKSDWCRIEAGFIETASIWAVALGMFNIEW